MSKIDTLKERINANPTLVTPEVDLVLNVLQQLEELELAVGSSTLETLVEKEEFLKLKLELEETKAKLEQAVFLNEPLLIPESFDDSIDLNKEDA